MQVLDEYIKLNYFLFFHKKNENQKLEKSGKEIIYYFPLRQLNSFKTLIVMY